MKKLISIILTVILIFTMAIPAFAGFETAQESINIVDSIENFEIGAIFSKISNTINKIYSFIMNIIFPEKIAITRRYLDNSVNWVEKTQYYEYGEELKSYSIPQKVSEKGMSLTVYYFNSWSPEIEDIVTKDMTYKANYSMAW